MTVLGRLAAIVMSKGVISRGWDLVLTGAVMLLVAWLLSTAGDTDAAAPYVAAAFAVLGLWCLVRGVRAETRGHRTQP